MTPETSLPKFVAIIALALLTFWFGKLANAPLGDGPRIVRLELAPTTEAANRFLRSWQDLPDWRARLLQHLRWDTWFICAYAPLLALLCWCAADQFGANASPLGRFLQWLAAGQLLAGAFDFVENWAMRHMIIDGVARDPWPQVSATASGIKWVLLLAFVPFALLAAGAWLIRRLKRQR